MNVSSGPGPKKICLHAESAKRYDAGVKSAWPAMRP